MDSSTIKRKEITLEVLKSFMSICDSYNLRWFACGGTALGAIRHKGMIPWDDDIDIEMPRPDYDKLVEIFRDNEFNDIALFHPELQDRYYYPFAKMVKKNTTLLERGEGVIAHFPLGIYIDIFPMDGVSDDFNEFIISRKKYADLNAKFVASTVYRSFTFKELLYSISCRGFKYTVKSSLYGILCGKSRRQRIINEMKNICRRYEFDKSDNIAVLCGYYKYKEYMPKKWFVYYDIGEFEGFNIHLANGCRSYLEKIFGDYMQLPPVEKRVSTHNFEYLNLSENVKFTDIMSQIGSKIF